MAATSPATHPKTYIKSAGVCARYGGVSLSWINRRIADSGFPGPTRFGPRGIGIDRRDRHWLLADLIQWEAEQALADKAVRS